MLPCILFFFRKQLFSLQKDYVSENRMKVVLRKLMTCLKKIECGLEKIEGSECIVELLYYSTTRTPLGSPSRASQVLFRTARSVSQCLVSVSLRLLSRLSCCLSVSVCLYVPVFTFVELYLNCSVTCLPDRHLAGLVASALSRSPLCVRTPGVVPAARPGAAPGLDGLRSRSGSATGRTGSAGSPVPSSPPGRRLSAVRLSTVRCPTLSLSRCPLSGCPADPLSIRPHCSSAPLSDIPLFHCPSVSQSPCPAFPLSGCPLSACSAIPLSCYPIVRSPADLRLLLSAVPLFGCLISRCPLSYCLGCTGCRTTGSSHAPGEAADADNRLTSDGGQPLDQSEQCRTGVRI